MKQVVQNLKSGQVAVVDVPGPLLQDQGILVRSRASLISAGTERMMVELSRKSLLGKARARPDLVRKVLDKLRRDGFLATFRAVRDRLDNEVPLGYSACGDVTAVGGRTSQFKLGQLVACAGAGYANHAQVNYVPHLLAAAVPRGVDAEAAAYSTVGSIALQGVRNAEVRVGEAVVVLGLGLIGQLTVQLLRAAGARVAALDPDADRVDLAAAHGAALAAVIEGERTETAVMQFTRGRGADAVLITAATSSNAPIEQAARLARDRARVVMVGVTGMDIPRTPYFKKELSFIVSRSYGPGRYDPQYEEHGHDYPVGYVRWTENRNLEAFLDLVAAGSVRPEVCTTHRFSIDRAEAAYEMILNGSQPYLGVLLTYPEPAAGQDTAEPARIELRQHDEAKPAGAKPVDKVGISFIGAGGFARSFHLPNLARLSEARLRGVVDASGRAARFAGKKFGFEFCAAEEGRLHEDQQTDAVFIVTPHSRHAEGVCRALAAGKSVFVEKPLAITVEQLRQVVETMQNSPGRLMVGFNRRFAPLAGELKQFTGGRGPLSVLYRCNAGPPPEDHWIADPAEGGRIIGEACHFFDFFAYLTDADPLTVHAAAPIDSIDDAAVTIDYSDGSVCHLTYTSVGPPGFSKERVEVFSGGCAGVLEDFRHLTLHSTGRRPRRRKSMQSDKGHAHEVAQFVAALKEAREMPIRGDSLIDTTLVGFAVLRSLHGGGPIEIARLREELVTPPTS